MTLHYELYWSFRSPYSYLLTPRLVALEVAFDVVGVVRPVYPLAVRTPEFFETRDPLWFSYFNADIHREGEYLGMPLRWPRPDPVYMDRQTGKYPKEQPYIHRLTQLGAAAAERGRGLAYLAEVSRLIWSGATDNWHEGDHLARAARRAGLDPLELATAVDGDPGRYDAVIKVNQDAQRAGGHYGVPMIVFNSEAFFGQDRFDQFKWRLGQQGLQPRAGKSAGDTGALDRRTRE